MNTAPLIVLKKGFRVAARPGGLAWSVAMTLCAAGVLLPASAVGHLLLAVLATTAILLLATARNWRAERRYAETLSLVAGLLIVGLVMTKGPSQWQTGLTPVFMTLTVLGLLTFTAWRFAPDWGQTGLHWALLEAVHGTLWAGLGLASVMFLIAVYFHSNAWSDALIYVAGALGGRIFGLLVHPRPNSLDYSQLARNDMQTGRETDDDPPAADWWKDV